MQVMTNSDEIAPTAAWDDGNFTYLKIPNHREIPAVFRVTADGTESVSYTHLDVYKRQGLTKLSIREFAS